jgi:nickel-dependent lactate racemase
MVLGRGSTSRLLSEEQVRTLCSEALGQLSLDGRRVLAIIPDNTRSGPVDLLFRTVYERVADRVSRLDFLIALGTHPPLSQDGIYRRVGISAGEHRDRFSKARFFNHRWQDPAQLTLAGTLSDRELAEITGGLLRQDVAVTVNRMVYDYDLLMIIGPTFPHEVVGFSGGNKYLFPGISGQEMIDAFHWLGALLTSAATIGLKDTLVRAVVDRAASLLPAPRVGFSLVVREGGLAGLFFGSPEEAYSAAADLSSRVHVVLKDHPFESVLAQAPEMYGDLWTGAKAMYKLEPVVADDGELILYAPHIDEISVTHGELIERIGYHVRDYFLKQRDHFADIPGGVMAHSTHLKGMGVYENGIEKPRITVTLATGIPEELCRRVNLGYRDPASVRVADWQEREDEGRLYAVDAGEILYRLRDDPFRPPSRPAERPGPP